MFPFVRTAPVRTFRKESRGCADLVVASLDPYWDFGKEAIAALCAALPAPRFSPGQHGLTVSVATQAGLLDLACTRVSPGELRFAREYLSYGRAGNLMRPVARQSGFVLRYTGLFVSADGSEALVSRDFDAVMEFLGYRITPWRRGFDTQDELFCFLGGHDLFETRPFAPHAVIPPSQGLRTTYGEAFAGWLEDRALVFCPDSRAAEALRSSALARACDAFPGFARRRGLHEALSTGTPARAQPPEPA